MGNLVQKAEFQCGHKRFEIPLENLSTGTYFLSVQGLGSAKAVQIQR